MTGDEVVVWHHQFTGHEFKETLGESEGLGSLVGCSPWDCKESNTTEWLNNKNNICVIFYLVTKLCLTLLESHGL